MWEYKNKGVKNNVSHPLSTSVPGMTGKNAKTSLNVMFEPNAFSAGDKGFGLVFFSETQK